MAAAASGSASTTCKTHRLIAPPLPKPYSSSSTQLPFKFTSLATAAPTSISCSLTRDSAALQMDDKNDNGAFPVLPRPDSFGRFGKYGGKYVPETLMHALAELEAAFHALANDEEFQVLSILFLPFLFFFSFLNVKFSFQCCIQLVREFEFVGVVIRFMVCFI